MKYTHVPRRASETVGPRERPFANAQVFETQALRICGQVRQLAQSSVSVSVECINQGFIVQSPRKGPQCTVVECDLNVASNIKPAAKIFAEGVEHLFDAC